MSDKLDMAMILSEIPKAFEVEEPEPQGQVNFHLPKSYQLKFKSVQKRTKYRFGKICQDILKKMIDEADQYDETDQAS